MGGHRLAGPDRAGFGSGVIAKREREIELGPVRAGEFGPALRAETAHVVVQPFQEIERVGMHVALGLAAGRKRAKPSLSRAVQNRLGHDRARGIARADKQHVEHFFRYHFKHRRLPCIVTDAVAGAIDHQFAVLLAELAALRRGQQIEHELGRPAQPDAQGRITMGRLIRMGCAIIASRSWSSVKAGSSSPSSLIGRALYADDVAHGNTHALDERFQQRAARRGFQILDHVRLDAGVTDETQSVARGAALRIVIDDDVGPFGCWTA